MRTSNKIIYSESKIKIYKNINSIIVIFNDGFSFLVQDSKYLLRFLFYPVLIFS